ncbi:MAG: hypothetical protein ABJ387_14955 [Balneola sp.]|jgi:uncharacterized protein YlxW (UPF0749 family)|uniref:hypothetical protein n=1 Tax=Balneola sp. EhC07 TaxID=1849360 RepID=UPI0007F502C3|nr:hypothetical protein [Balneola sp. EhC07]MBO6572998.1 hypothetical protein [Balneola sp.]OAN61747.1 hypothetical protein A8B79_04800 [Balneola sp. EhC07]
MLFGLPWWAIIPLVAIIGGFITKYREQELKHEEKRMASTKEIHELRKIIQNLKARIEKLEGSVSSSGSDVKKNVPLDDIEIKDEYYSDGNDDSTRNRVQN